MIGIMLVNRIDDGLFGREIRVTDVIVVALLLNVQLARIGHLADQDITGFTRGHDRHIQ